MDLEESTPRRALGMRSVGVGLIGALVVAMVTPYNDYIINNTFFIGNHFPIGIIFLMVVLILVVNVILRAWTRGAHLTPGEMVVIMAMMWVAGSIPSSGLMRYWAPMLVSPFYYVRNFKHWEELLPQIPSWMVPSKDQDSSVVVDFFHGIERDGSIPWDAWLWPFLTWGIFLIALFIGIFCLATLLRRQWADAEKLAFPLAMIPLEMVREPEPGRLVNRLFRDKRLWVAASIVIAIYTLNGLNLYFPKVPAIPTHFSTAKAFTEFPWYYLPWWIKWSGLYFSVLAVAFFLTTEISFSLWFFVIMFALIEVFAAWLGMPYRRHVYGQQQVGAYLAFMVTMIWVSRRHLLEVFRVCIRGSRGEDADEYLPYRVAVGGFLLSLVVSVAWLMLAEKTGREGAEQPWDVAAFWGALAGSLITVLTIYILWVVMARVVAESGLLFVQSNWYAPEMMYATPHAYSQTTVLMSAMTQRMVVRDLRECLLPFAANSLRAADGVRTLNKRAFVVVLLVTVVIALVASAWIHGIITYKYGGKTMNEYAMKWHPRGAYEEAGRINDPSADRRAEGRIGQAIFGASLISVLSFLRLRFMAWPLHPVGYLMANTYAIGRMWFSLFVGWAIKALVLRYGGAATYNRWKPFFIGLIIGEAIVGTAWMIVGIILGAGEKTVRILPG